MRRKASASTASDRDRKPETGNLKPEVRQNQVSSFSSPIQVSGLKSQISAPIQVSGFKSQVSTDATASAIVAYFLDAAALLGVPKSVAAIYGICFASPVPLSFAEIQEKLDLSAGSISQGLKVLREVGALKVAEGRDLAKAEKLYRAKGEISQAEKLKSESIHPAEFISACQRVSVSAFSRSSAARYVPDLELRRLVQHFLDKRVGPQLASGRDRVAALLGGMDAANPVRARLEHLRNWHAKADALIPLAQALLAAP